MKALRIYVSGIVQGVGFRPFIYRLATSLNLKGYVCNIGGAEVEIFVEGDDEQVRRFREKLVREKPPTALIESIIVEEAKPKGYRSFKILKSKLKTKYLSMIPPDFAVCKYCLEEVLSEKSRWFKYPFNSCAWCGPRFSMIEKIPYDRENTAMRDFPLCEECLREYQDPNNIRRFHAQGISCPKCGPKVWLVDREGEVVECKDPIAEAAKLINEGYIVAVKGIGGFHIACLASEDEVVLELRKRKRRPQKPFALMALNVDVASKLIYLSEQMRNLLASPMAPIVISLRKDDAPVSKYVAPGLKTLGVELAYTPLHYLLLSDVKDNFAIMTSGNPKGMPICKDNSEALTKLRNIVDYFLLHNRRIVNRVDDSVIRFTLNRPMILRRSRGFVPTWIKLTFKVKKPIIGLGAHLNNTITITLGNVSIPSQFLGDMETLENLEFLKEALNFLTRNYRVKLEESILSCDMHPSYLTTYYANTLAKQYKTPLIRVQHHHAHIVSVMVDNKLPVDEEVVGIAMDGVGYGIDGKIWGGEVILASYRDFRRVGHLKYVAMPGGDLATKYPLRMLVAFLKEFMEDEEVIKTYARLGFIDRLRYGLKELKLVLAQCKNPRIKTSSTGRFLDSVSSLLGVCFERTYEGEPAIKLEEFSYGGKIVDGIDARIYYDGGFHVVDTPRIIEEILNVMDMAKPRDIAFTVQYQVGFSLGKIALKYVSRGRRKVVVSGGAAVNSIILKGIFDAISDRAEVLVARRVPCNDEGISLGQTVIAAFKAGVIEVV